MATLLLAGAFALVACDQLPKYYVIPRDVPPPLTVGADANGKTITVARTQQLVVRLPAGPSAGKEWRVEIGGDRAMFPSGQTPMPVAGAGDAQAGASGATVFVFRADAIGKTNLKFAYSTPADTARAPDQVVAFDVESVAMLPPKP